ncbi:hypothetical protein [Enterobacter pseudoroggenkampii]|uniref:hypothetical protein n=1 Tax=Enterobacter pseudoroggenkampii TaxID=2996112 RepID=UPI0022652BD5|nr:hypothetical protein [Enterobacter pseudoroggenkampii]MCX8289120.1 hypothetical protein [Enterobacter pseudoroggenkampii]
MERYECEDQKSNHLGCWYAVDEAKLKKRQQVFERDFTGRVILLRLDTVIIRTKASEFTFTPLYYKGKKMVLQCNERPDSRTQAYAKDLMVITDQLEANKVREKIKFEYIKGNRRSLPRYRATVLDENDDVVSTTII